MSSVFVAHGVIAGATKGRPTHRNLLDEQSFLRHLGSRAPYVSLDAALRGEGDALTIDDATVAAGRASELARIHGHEVTLFVNPFNVESRTPYFFAVLNTALEQRKERHVTVAGRSLSFETPSEQSEARAAIKRWITSGASEELRVERTRAAAEMLVPGGVSVPPHLETLTKEQLLLLAGQGVRIANHGWTHGALLHLEAAAVREDIMRGADWIRLHIGGDPLSFAVPFGDFVPHSNNSPPFRWCFLCTDNLNPGLLGPRVVNRLPLKLGKSSQ